MSDFKIRRRDTCAMCGQWQRWIQLRERPPETHKPVLVWVAGCHAVGCMYSDDHWGVSGFDGLDIRNSDVKGWRELPAGPEVSA
jgi:hypothetical protein